MILVEDLGVITYTTSTGSTYRKGSGIYECPSCNTRKTIPHAHAKKADVCKKCDDNKRQKEMMDKLYSTENAPKLLKDLGQQFSKNSKRKYHFGLFECPDCEEPFRTAISEVVMNGTETCKKCAANRRSKKQSITELPIKLVEDLGVVAYSGDHSRRIGMFECINDACNNTFKAAFRQVKEGRVRCIECAKRDSAEASTTHGMSSHPLYTIWFEQKRRCLDENRDCYKDYGGRGITISEEFKNDFKIWFEYVTSLDSYDENWNALNLTLDRVDNDGNYERGNLRWATKQEQALNKRPPKRGTGYAGVARSGDKFAGTIGYNYKNNWLGYFDTIKETVEARNQYIIDNNLPHPIQEYKEEQ